MIAVFGTSGQVGSLVAARLAELGVEACAVVRRPMLSVALPIRYADLDEPAALRRALAGVDRVLLLTPSGPRQGAQEAAVLEAALATGVSRVVKLSGGAATLGPNGTTSTSTTHWRSEQAIERSGIGFTFLRPAPFAQPFLAQLAPIAARLGVLPNPVGAAAVAFVDLRDVADAAVAALTAGSGGASDLKTYGASGLPGAAWSLTGPRPLTLAAIGAELGLPVVRVPVAATGRALRRRGATEFEVDHALRMTRYLAAGGASAATDHVHRLTGVPPRSLASTLEELRPLFMPTRPALTRWVRPAHKEHR